MHSRDQKNARERSREVGSVVVCVVCIAGTKRLLARDRKMSSRSVSYVQCRICSHTQRQRAREVGSVSMVCAEQDLLACSAQESIGRGLVRSGQYHMCEAGFARTLSAREQHEKSGPICLHTQLKRAAREVGSGGLHMCRAGFACTLSAKEQRER